MRNSPMWKPCHPGEGETPSTSTCSQYTSLIPSITIESAASARPDEMPTPANIDRTRTNDRNRCSPFARLNMEVPQPLPVQIVCKRLHQQVHKSPSARFTGQPVTLQPSRTPSRRLKTGCWGSPGGLGRFVQLVQTLSIFCAKL